MPLGQVIAPRQSLDNSAQQALVSRLSNAVLKAEGAPIDDPGAQSLVWAYYHELDATAIYVGGKNLEKAPLRLSPAVCWRLRLARPSTTWLAPTKAG
jgi:hypothetical protein